MTPMLQAASMAAHEMLAPDDVDDFAEKLTALGMLISTVNDLCTAHIEVLIQIAFKLEDMQTEERVH